MSTHFLKLLIAKILLQIKILQIQLAIKLFHQKRTVPNLPGPEYIVLHHGGGQGNFEQTNNHHKDRWGFKSSLGYYNGYHYWIEDTGEVIQARADNEEAAHTADPNNPHWWNTHSIGICLQGDLTKREATRGQMDNLGVLVNRLRKKYNIPRSKVKGHQEITSTLCPGALMSWIKKERSQ